MQYKNTLSVESNIHLNIGLQEICFPRVEAKIFVIFNKIYYI